MVLLCEAVKVKQSGCDQVDGTGLQLTVRNLFLVDNHGLTTEFISNFLNLTVVLDVVDCLRTLQVKFEALLGLEFLKSENDLIDVLENLRLVNFN